MSRLRWYAKKASRAAVACGTWATGRLSSQPRPRVHVLTYHRFGDALRDPFAVSLEHFEAQMRWLARRGLPVSLDRLEAFVGGGGTLPDEAVVVTVDDGFRSLLSVLPVVREYAVPMVAFVCPGLIEGPAASDPEPRLRWDDVETLAAAGVTIGSHSWSHRSMARLERAEAAEEAVRSREALERRLGRPTRAFAYPFGTVADFDEGTAAILRQCGYTTAFTSQHGSIRSGADPLALPRVKVEGGEGMWLFQLLALGALDPWAVVDRTLWRLQGIAP